MHNLTPLPTDSIFKSGDAIGRAEATLMGGVAASNWQAAGLALIVERLDAVLDRLDVLVEALAPEVAE